ncbi:MAG: hypothetical protein J07HN6_02724 [Halonotius sp. J07HN6]|nr:MAG: hypothetical protein J07HN6_02724 [Halonotius sp. J07HN6]
MNSHVITMSRSADQQRGIGFSAFNTETWKPKSPLGTAGVADSRQRLLCPPSYRSADGDGLC